MAIDIDHYEDPQQLIDEGVEFLEKLHGVDADKSILGKEVLYNMVCLGIEAVFTGKLLAYDAVIDHSNIFRLLRELGQREAVPHYDDWMATAKLMAKFQSYCSLEVVKVKIPNKNELEMMFKFGFEVEEFAKMPKVA